MKMAMNGVVKYPAGTDPSMVVGEYFYMINCSEQEYRLETITFVYQTMYDP